MSTQQAQQAGTLCIDIIAGRVDINKRANPRGATNLLLGPAQ